MNHLKNSLSPYLLQHAHNPVEWYPWEEQAFIRAQEEDKPVFLSIGYATCHWCHVMEQDSFEDKHVAALMNESFISIKVDREERPDIDALYMTVCQIMTKTGGWPLSIIMTPQKRPFYAATYIPKESQYGRIGMLELIPYIQSLWNTDRKRLLTVTDHIEETLLSVHESRQRVLVSTEHVLQSAYEDLSARFDAAYGGFGTAPKFPTPHKLLLLTRIGDAERFPLAMDMVKTTVENMYHGAIWDHLGYGMHRYATDRKWLLPHFEKMIYDQALMVVAVAEAYMKTSLPLYEDIATEIITYVLRDMHGQGAGFYSAEDADSPGKGEGAYYVWSWGELLQTLNQQEFNIAKDFYGITEQGSFVEEQSNKTTGNNLLHITVTPEKLSEKYQLSPAQMEAQIQAMNKKLLHRRMLRTRPFCDDKILVDWNGLMIAALARAGVALKNENYIKIAGETVNFIEQHMRDQDGRLLHRYRAGHAGIDGFLNDYAFYMWGLIELYQATFHIHYLTLAKQYYQKINQLFLNEEQGGYYGTHAENHDVFIRQQESFDGAIPSGNSVLAYGLLLLSRITHDQSIEQHVYNIHKRFQDLIATNPSNHAFMLLSIDYLQNPSFEVILVGERGDPLMEQFITALHDHYMPRKTVFIKEADDDEKWWPHLKDYTKIHGKSTAYVCHNYVCNLPTNEPQEMVEQLLEHR